MKKDRPFPDQQPVISIGFASHQRGGCAEHHKNLPVLHLEVGQCRTFGCTGTYIYTSMYIEGESLGTFREHTECSCNECGAMLNPKLPRFRALVEEARKAK
jgi:hypothetical protein